MKIILHSILLVLLAGCSVQSSLSIEAKAQARISSLDESSRNDILALLTMLDEQAAITDPGAKRYIPYEFRIVMNNKSERKIHRIDSSISFIKRKDYSLCIGENASKERVYQIINLPGTYRIRFCPYE